ncbi:MAG: uroporphyrinogen-III C-methyltransferase [Cyanobacteria bacterium QS_8_64_29]|nr:MAG: uroporphyrinogen-III C-methyltransferase [Cyanobacteria bacterium QS_8_64_29]
MSARAGKAYLVGAGPGTAAYLTRRAQQAIAGAEVLLYDGLADPELLQWVPPDCQLVDVSKRAGRNGPSQAQIERWLVAYCQQGLQAVRLKGGDPLIFGRARGEMQALQAARCDFEIVPGISSALAAPLLAGIPLTDAEWGRCFAVLSAHQPDCLDWPALARLDALVLLMGGRHLAIATERLQRHGRAPETPVAVVRDAARPQQQVWIGTLADIANQTANASLAPSVTIVGEVVQLRIPMPSSAATPEAQPLPLSGKTALVTRSAQQAGALAQLLQQQGARVLEAPALEIGPPSSWAPLDGAIARLDGFHWLILTSGNGVRYFFERLAARGLDGRALAGLKIAAVGKKTAERLQDCGVRADFVPPNYVADSLIETFPEPVAGRQFLFPRVETGGREMLVAALTEQGGQVTEVPAYQSGCPSQLAPAALAALQNRAVDAVTFASTKTVNNFARLLAAALPPGSPETPASLLQPTCIASIGPQTSQACREAFGRLDVEASEHTLAGLTQAITQFYGDGA